MKNEGESLILAGILLGNHRIVRGCQGGIYADMWRGTDAGRLYRSGVARTFVGPLDGTLLLWCSLLADDVVTMGEGAPHRIPYLLRVCGGGLLVGFRGGHQSLSVLALQTGCLLSAVSGNACRGDGQCDDGLSGAALCRADSCRFTGLSDPRKD